jgi:hypothetical protein
VIDPDWEWTDHAGHVHRGVTLGDSTEEVRVECFCSAVDEPHDVYDHRVCRTCGQRLPGPPTVPGPEWWTPPVPDRMTLSGMMADGRWVRAEVRDSAVITELYRRVTMTSTPSIVDRIVESWVAEHPEAVVETRWSSAP